MPRIAPILILAALAAAPASALAAEAVPLPLAQRAAAGVDAGPAAAHAAVSLPGSAEPPAAVLRLDAELPECQLVQHLRLPWSDGVADERRDRTATLERTKRIERTVREQVPLLPGTEATEAAVSGLASQATGADVDVSVERPPQAYRTVTRTHALEVPVLVDVAWTEEHTAWTHHTLEAYVAPTAAPRWPGHALQEVVCGDVTVLPAFPSPQPQGRLHVGADRPRDGWTVVAHEAAVRLGGAGGAPTEHALPGPVRTAAAEALAAARVPWPAEPAPEGGATPLEPVQARGWALSLEPGYAGVAATWGLAGLGVLALLGWRHR